MLFQNEVGYRHLLIYRDIFGNARLCDALPAISALQRYSAIMRLAIGLLPHRHGLKCASKSLNGPVLCSILQALGRLKGVAQYSVVRMPVHVSRRSQLTLS